MSPKQTLRRAQQKVNQARRSKTLASVAKAAEKRSGRQGPAVFGPYPNRGKWRLVLVDDSGRQARVFSTRAEAEEIKARVLEDERSRQTKTIGESIAEYEDYRLKYRGVKLLTAENETFYLRDLLPIDAPLASLTTEKAARIYSDCVQRPNRRTGKPLSPNTHHWLLLITKCWAKWCVKSKLLSTNPFAAVEPIGKGGVGKQQLRIEEAQRLDRHLVQRAEHGDTAAIGVLLMLHLGLRQGEVTARVARDVDADCRILHIPLAKRITLNVDSESLSGCDRSCAHWSRPKSRISSFFRPPRSCAESTIGGERFTNSVSRLVSRLSARTACADYTRRSRLKRALPVNRSRARSATPASL